MADDNVEYAGSDTPVPADSPTPESDTASQPDPNVQPSPGKPDPEAADPVLQESWSRYEEDRQHEKEADVYYQKMRDQFNEIDQRLRTTPLPEVPETEPIPDPRKQQVQQNTLGTMIGQLLTMGMIGSAVFGKHRNPWATAALYNGFGSFINGYQQGQTQLANEQHQNWHDLAEYIQKENERKTKTYNEVLANKSLDLRQQMDVLKTIAAQRQDAAMYRAAESQSLSEVMKVLDYKLKANISLSKSQLHIASATVAQYLKSKEGVGWSVDVREKSGGKLDPSRSLDEFDRARKQYPISDWLKTHTGKSAKPETYAGLAKEVEGAVGKGQAEGWIKALETGQYKRGDIKEETTQGWFGPSKEKKWVPSASGKSYSFGESDQELQQNVQPAKVIEDLRRRYQNVGAQGTTGGQQQEDPTLTLDQVRNKPPGTKFYGTDGIHRRVVSQNPLVLHQIKPEEEESSGGQSPSEGASSEEESSD